jgi:hypothetical protein
MLELWENASPAGDHTRDAEQRVEVVLTKLAQGERDRQIAHADVELRVDALVIRVVVKRDIEGHCIEDR